MFKANTPKAATISGKYPAKYPGQGHVVVQAPYTPPNPNVVDTWSNDPPEPSDIRIQNFAFANGKRIDGTLDLSVINAARADVRLGKTFISDQGLTFTGLLDLTEGDIAAGDVILGKIGYGLDGAKITGTLDLTEADIVAGDVALGKIAYGLNGVKIIGTAE